MGEDRFEMGQKERDRLKILHEAATGLITQKQAAGQLHLCERQVRRLVAKLRSVGDSRGTPWTARPSFEQATRRID
jgi:DNA-binding Lrp family transcriptional regulator